MKDYTSKEHTEIVDLSKDAKMLSMSSDEQFMRYYVEGLFK